MFPSEQNDSHRSYLTCLLRPELVMNNPHRVCSDACSPWISIDVHAQFHNQSCASTHARLLEEVIPNFATFFTSHRIKQRYRKTAPSEERVHQSLTIIDQISEECHRYGMYLL